MNINARLITERRISSIEGLEKYQRINDIVSAFRVNKINNEQKHEAIKIINE